MGEEEENKVWTQKRNVSSTEDIMEQEDFERESNLTLRLHVEQNWRDKEQRGIPGKQSSKEWPKNS